MQVLYFLVPTGFVAERRYSDSVCKSILRYSTVIYDAVCYPHLIGAGAASLVKEKLEQELDKLKQLVHADDVQLIALVEDYISLCNTYPMAIVYSENDG